MSWSSPGRNAGLTLRQAALVAGFAYILPLSYVGFSIWPKLVIPGNIEQTVLNISSHPRLFAIAILLYLITFIEDILIAWALYVLLVPVNRSLSLFTAWFRLVYAVIALFAGGMAGPRVAAIQTLPAASSVDDWHCARNGRIGGGSIVGARDHPRSALGGSIFAGIWYRHDCRDDGHYDEHCVDVPTSTWQADFSAEAGHGFWSAKSGLWDFCCLSIIVVNGLLSAHRNGCHDERGLR